MGIDQNGMSVSNKPSPTPESRGGKGRTADEAEAPQGGFLALLNLLEPQVVVPEIDENPVALPQPGRELVSEDDASTAPPMLIDMPTLSAPVDASAALRSLPRDAVVNDQALAAERSALPKAAIGPAALDAKLSADSSHLSRVDGNQLNAEAQTTNKVSPSADGIPQLNTEVVLEQAPRVSLARGRAPVGVESKINKSAAQAESSALKAASVVELTAREGLQALSMLPRGVDGRVIAPAERVGAKTSIFGAMSGVEGAWSQYALQAGNHSDSPPPLPTSSATPMQQTVADKVSYWVTQGVQSAELKLEGFGGEPVEVSILLKGDEAHVGFRTDQPEVRQMLEGALTQLKDSLGREGVVLSGVSVGGSGQEDGGAQDRRRRPGANQAMAPTTDATPAPGLQRVISSVGRSLDIFV